MKNPKNKGLGILGISACVLCCTLPVLGALFSVTALVSLGVWLEKALIMFIGLGAAAFILQDVIEWRNNRTSSCSFATAGTDGYTTDCSCNPISTKNNIFN